jgi:amidohydrolase
MRDHWSGTLVLVFQPDEERSGGALRMVEDGLYSKVPIPDVLLGQHVASQRSGQLGMIQGVQLSASDTLKITLHGRGSHASQPQLSVDPIVMMASCILRLQTIVSREIDTGKDMAVVTVGRAVGGLAENVIPATAEFTVNVRTIDEGVREKVLASIKRIVRAEADASGSEQEPTIDILGSFPVTDNDSEVTEIVSHTFNQVFGDDFRPENFPRVNGSEDFSLLARAINRPYCFWFFGGTDPEQFDKAEREGRLEQDIPTNHSPFFAPVMQPTLEVGIDAITSAALTFLR